MPSLSGNQSSSAMFSWPTTTNLNINLNSLSVYDLAVHDVSAEDANFSSASIGSAAFTSLEVGSSLHISGSMSGSTMTMTGLCQLPYLSAGVTTASSLAVNGSLSQSSGTASLQALCVPSINCSGVVSALGLGVSTASVGLCTATNMTISHNLVGSSANLSGNMTAGSLNVVGVGTFASVQGSTAKFSGPCTANTFMGTSLYCSGVGTIAGSLGVGTTQIEYGVSLDVNGTIVGRNAVTAPTILCNNFECIYGSESTGIVTTKTLNATNIKTGIITSTSFVGTNASLTGDLNVLGTITASALTGFSPLTLGTSISLTGAGTNLPCPIPSWARRITVCYAPISSTNTSVPSLQLGTSSTSFVGTYSGQSWAGNSLWNDVSTSIPTNNTGGGSGNFYGSVVLMLVTSGTGVGSSNWTFMGATCQPPNYGFTQAGSVKLSGVLSYVRVTTVAGTGNLSGNVSIYYE